MTIRYLKITLIDGARFILRVTHESPQLLSGVEVDAEGDEVVPRGKDAQGRPYHQRVRHVQRSLVQSAVEMRMNPTYATLEVVPRKGHSTKTSAQLDAEIAEALSARKRASPRPSPPSELRPVEGLRIPADSRHELIKFWHAHPSLRSGCLRKYGFDPIDEESDYWRYGLAEPGHRDVRRAVRQADGVFSLALVKRWEAEELRDEAPPARALSHATKKIPPIVRAAIEEHALDVIQSAYRRFEIVGGKEPCVTVGLVTDHLRQAHMPEDFRYVTKERQRTWTRSVLESMRRAGQIGSSFGAKTRCYEPKR